MLKRVVNACPAAHIHRSFCGVDNGSVLSTFDILKPLDEYGMPIEPTIYNSSLMLCAWIRSSFIHVIVLLNSWAVKDNQRRSSADSNRAMKASKQ